MPLTAEQITVIRSSLDPSGYKAGAEQIVAANQKLAASGETVVQTQAKATRVLVDNGDVADPTQIVTAGATLFAHLLRKYGDVSLAILAYHDGETRIDRVLAGGGTVSPSEDALDQARRVMSGYGGTGLLAARPSMPSVPDLPV